LQFESNGVLKGEGAAEEQGLLKKSTFETATALKTGGPQAFCFSPPLKLNYDVMQ